MHSKGEIWIANLNPQKKSFEVGKTRPVLILQNNLLNHSEYGSTIVMPLTTECIDNAQPLRYRVVKREKLKEDSDLLVAHIRAIDNSRLIEKIATLKNDELDEVWQLLKEIL
jgi:mRNA interferase MazF